MGEQVPNISEYVVGNVRAPESEQLDDLNIKPSYISTKNMKSKNLSSELECFVYFN